MNPRWARLVCLLILMFPELPAGGPAAPGALEERLQALVEDERVTVVRLWAPWCSNCRAEMKPEGWAKFIGEHPDVQFVFVCLWHRGRDPKPVLEAAELGAQPNLVLLTHPDEASTAPGRLKSLLGFPVTWIPTTWVFREGKLRYAFNYGEIRFELLRQLVADATNPWDH